MDYPIIADSGANFHMFRDREFFLSLSPATGQVILGHGKTTLPIQGVGTIKLRIGAHILLVDNVRFVPGLSESIYSLFYTSELQVMALVCFLMMDCTFIFLLLVPRLS
jgi:hypothetical protein